MQNLVNEVLQAAVGNHFRNTIQNLEAVRFIETRAEVQASALEAIRTYLNAYDVETRGVYIQDVDFPDELVEVLTKREIANQEKTTYAEEERAEIARIEREKAKGTADMQAQLAQSTVGIEIKNNEAQAREAQARGEAAFVRLTGDAEASKTRAVGLADAAATEALGLARAAGFRAQTEALGQTATALVAVANAVADGHITVVPEVLVAGGGGAIEGLAATLMRTLGTGNGGNGSRAPEPAVDAVIDAPADLPRVDGPVDESPPRES
jgi:regulator of protease activity HflC (stomatin/prohibitin superfamily)